MRLWPPLLWPRELCRLPIPLSIGTVGLKAHDLVAFGIDEADLVICIGYDMVEYDPCALEPEQGQADYQH